MTILVTGAAGFIGSHLCESLLNQNYSVIGIDNFDPFYARKIKEINIEKIKNNPNYKFFEMDIRDKHALRTLFVNNDINAVIHLAAKAGVRPSIESITDYYDVNIDGTLAILETMKQNGVRKLIFASSSSVYGNNLKVPFSESDQVDNPISPYAATKKSGELLCHVYCYIHDFDITCLRFFTVYGPRQRPDLAIHKFTRLIDQGMELPVYGDGTNCRDFTYIDDILAGVIGSLHNLKGFKIFNLGESRMISINKLINTLEVALGKKALVKHYPLQQGDVCVTHADISKATNEIGYRPNCKFEDGIQEFVKWYQLNKNIIYY